MMGRWPKTNMIYFRGMTRRQLQRLCKKHGIPANKASAAMVEALCTLFNSEFLVRERLPGQLIPVSKVEPQDCVPLADHAGGGPWAPCESEVCADGSGTAAFEDLQTILNNGPEFFDVLEVKQELKDEEGCSPQLHSDSVQHHFAHAPTEWRGLTNEGQEQEEQCGAAAITEDCCLLDDEPCDKYERLERFTASVEELFVWEEDDGPEVNKPECQVEARPGNRVEAVDIPSSLEHLEHVKTSCSERVTAPEEEPQVWETVIDSVELDGAANISSVPRSTGVGDAEPNDSCIHRFHPDGTGQDGDTDVLINAKEVEKSVHVSGLDNREGDVAEAWEAPCQPPIMEFYVEQAEGLSLVVELNSEHTPVDELFQRFRRLESISEGVVPPCNDKLPPVGRVSSISSILDLCCSKTAKPLSETGIQSHHRAQRQNQRGTTLLEHDIFV